MCDKLQTSKDGSVDLSHGRQSDCRSVQPLSTNGSNSSSYKKQKKAYGKDKRSDWSGSPSPITKRDSLSPGVNPRGQRSSKQNREGRQGNKRENGLREYNKTSFQVESVYDYLSPRVGESGKKKPSTSLNHLLNFTVASTDRSYTRAGTSPIVRSRRRRNTSHSYNKEEFLQANCQFVVSATGDYTFDEPDKLVDWDCIQQVRVFCHEIPSCPICLYLPRAAKITRCGHVYCWSCLLHYLSLSQKKWSKCPICNESIYKKDIKSVAALSSPQYKVGDSITMKLMIRERGSTQVFPKTEWNDKKYKMLTVEDSCVNKFVKLLSATPNQVLSLIIGPEKRALQSQLAGLGKDDAAEKCFIEEALEDLKDRESEMTKAQSAHLEVENHLEVEKIVSDAQSLVSDVPPPSPPVSSDSPCLVWTSYSDQFFESGFKNPFSEPEEDSGCYSLDGEAEGCRESTPLPSLDTSEENSLEVPPSIECSFDSEESTDNGTSSSGHPSGEHLVYFYQAFDGQHLYMHPVNTKCLSKEHGSLKSCPDEINAVILEMEQLTMSEDIRGRYRSLSHLPLTCELALCELDLKPPILSKQTLGCFAKEIQRRQQKRTKKKKDERRRDKRAEARTPQAEYTFRVPSALELTPEKFHDFLSLASSPSLVEPGSARQSQPLGTEKIGTSPSPLGKENVASTPSPPSFAQALQGRSPSSWPVKPPAKGIEHGQSNNGIDTIEQHYDEDENSVPSFHEAFNEAFETASQSVLAAHKASGGKPGSKTARKGRKKLVLFTTGGSRGAV